MSVILGAAAIAAILVAVFAVLGFAIAAMRRNPHSTSGALSSGVLEVQSLLEPSKRHTVETMQDESREEDESGE